MLATTSRQISLALFLCVMAVGVNPGHAAEESLHYTLGKYTSYASHCGFHKLFVELRNRYGDFDDFNNGRRQNDLSKYDRVSGLACGKLERTLEGFLEEERARDAK